MVATVESSQSDHTPLLATWQLPDVTQSGRVPKSLLAGSWMKPRDPSAHGFEIRGAFRPPATFLLPAVWDAGREAMVGVLLWETWKHRPPEPVLHPL